jgi:hypothetical protein
MPDFRKYAEEAKARPNEYVVAAEDPESFNEAMATAASLLGQEPADIKGYVVIGVDQSDNLVIGGNIGGGADQLARFLLDASRQVDPEVIAEMFATVTLAMIGFPPPDEGDEG